MPVTVRSWSSLSVIYSVAHFSWNTKGFEFSASYAFNNDAMCAISTVMAQSGMYFLKNSHLFYLTKSAFVSGEIKSTNISTVDELNYFYHQNCIWILDSNVERQLFIELSSNQNSK